MGTAPAAAVAAGETPSAAPRLAAVPEPAAGDSVDLLKVVALPIAKRAAPVVAGLTAGAALGFLFGRRNRDGNRRPDDLHAALLRLLS